MERNKEKTFLALTSMEQAIDRNADNILYVEDGCLKNIDNIEKYHIAEKCLKNKSDILDAMKLVDVVKEDLLVILSQELNKLHKIEFDTETWRLIMMPWIEFYPEAMYNKLINVNKAIDEGTDYTWILEDDSKDTPYYWEGFWMWGLKNDKYNYQMYSNVCEFKAIEVTKKIKIDRPKTKHKSTYYIKKIIKKVRIHILNFFARYAETLVMNPDYFEFNIREKIYMIVRSKFKIGFYYVESNEDFKKVNLKNREMDLQDKIITDVEIERLLLKYAMKDIPVTYNEILKAEIKKASKYKCKKIISADDYSFYHANIVMALNKNRGGKFYEIPIGGDGNILDGASEARIVSKIADVVYTSGWNDINYPCEIRHTTNPRYWKAVKAANVNQTQKVDILYVGTAIFGYRLILNNMNSLFSRDYIEESINLLEHIAKDTGYSVRARFFCCKTGWNIENRLLKRTNLVELDDQSKRFVDSAQEAKIIIADAFGTPWAETLVMNKPLIMVVPKCLEFYSESGSKLVNKLKSIGLYYNTYEEVVDVLNKIDDIDSWWATKQDVINSIRKEYCWCADNPKKEWIDEFIKISKE